MPHKRIDIEQDDIALQTLSGLQYKVLHYLANRADQRGVCFPTLETIARGTNQHARNVIRAMEFLEQNAVIGYHRKDEVDPITRHKLCNVYQINPDYISLAAENMAESRLLWKMLMNRCAVSMRLWSHINQQPVPQDQFKEPVPEDQYQKTNTNNQRSGNAELPVTGSDVIPFPEGTDTKTEVHKDGKDAPIMDEPYDKTNTQRNAPEQSPSSAAATVSRYVNPAGIGTPLPDSFHENLAIEVRSLGIPLPLARGFVNDYGYDRAKVALEAVRVMGTEAKNPAGLFRSIIQKRLTDEVAVAQQRLNKMFR